MTIGPVKYPVSVSREPTAMYATIVDADGKNICGGLHREHAEEIVSLLNGAHAEVIEPEGRKLFESIRRSEAPIFEVIKDRDHPEEGYKIFLNGRTEGFGDHAGIMNWYLPVLRTLEAQIYVLKRDHAPGLLGLKDDIGNKP